MADGIPCVYCGHNESDHDTINKARSTGRDIDVTIALQRIIDSSVVVKPYTVPLKSCSGYEPEDKDLAEHYARLRECRLEETPP